MNPFRPRDKVSEELRNIELEVKKDLNELSRIANDLLLDQRYKRFADLIIEAEKNTIDLFLRYKESDPYKYKAKVDEFLIELRVYKNILNSIKDLSNPPQKENVSFVQNFKNQMSEVLDKIR